MTPFCKAKSKLANTPVIDVPDGFALPPKTQWGFTPSLQNSVTENGISGRVLTGTSVGPNVTLHHDGDETAFSIQRPDDCGTGLLFEFGDFPNGFFSLAFDLPADGGAALSRNDLLRFIVQTQTDQPFQAYVRLNLQHGPNTEQLVRMLDIGGGATFVEFDLFYSEYGEKHASSAWIDLIFNDPAHKKVSLEHVIILRRARASL